ncbi:uncharacterized protein EI90DRAFT_3064844 [Cantharellus anzutake]|uniref:uncharacterized protein n=1 Tax=Cantharellus anzutake TaxID=1750568 RepID=UPI001906C70B|nr:uncharacterized protein EI90DRAFT_3064844 [Cantharellus anzutake]KAF8328618.1 hypothetical protein EI90DRAFT_3064844 [Cantharellus anzutake]
MLSLQWIKIYKYWITYPILLIRYLNRALMKFDSKVVIPTQFVLFNFTAITGSAVLYRDFEHIAFERMVIFLYGCASTFLGVFVLARPTEDHQVEEEAHDRAHVNIARSSSLPSHPSRSSSFNNNAAASGVIRSELGTPVRRVSGSGSKLRNRASSTSIGFSPGQHLLWVTGSTHPSPSQNLNGSSITLPVGRSPAPRPRPRLGSSRSPSRDGEGRQRPTET